jgi:hypothetical protein
MMTAHQALKNKADYGEICGKAEDLLYEGKYYGTNVHPFELVFMKTNRRIDDFGLEKLTEWVDGIGYESYDYCH